MGQWELLRHADQKAMRGHREPTTPEESVCTKGLSATREREKTVEWKFRKLQGGRFLLFRTSVSIYGFSEDCGDFF